MGEHKPGLAKDGAELAAAWPIAAPYLDALHDMGLTDTQIGRYFGVAPQRVSELTDAYHKTDSTDA